MTRGLCQGRSSARSSGTLLRPDGVTASGDQTLAPNPQEEAGVGVVAGGAGLPGLCSAVCGVAFPTPGSLSLCLPRGCSVQTHVPGHRRDLHCEAWGPFPGWDPLCAKWSAGGRDPEPVRGGQLQGRRVWAAGRPPSHGGLGASPMGSQRLRGSGGGVRGRLRALATMKLQWSLHGCSQGAGVTLEPAGGSEPSVTAGESVTPASRVALGSREGRPSTSGVTHPRVPALSADVRL